MLLTILAPTLALLPSIVVALAIHPIPIEALQPLRQAGLGRPLFRPSTGKAADYLSPHDIQGINFISPYIDQTVTDLRGVVTAKATGGFYIQSLVPDEDERTSEGLYIFGSASLASVTVGDFISLGCTIAEYASSSDYLRLTECVSPTNITVISSGNAITPLVLGQDRTPPGSNIFFADEFQLPAATVDVETFVESLEPASRGLDFWESLEGMLVTIQNPRAVSRSSRFRDIWVVGESYATTVNAQGGINLVKLGEGQWDSNPEAIHLSYPLDGTQNPTTTVVLGTKFETITGIVSYAFGFPVLYPTTVPTIISSPSTVYPQSPLRGDGACEIGLANYNVLNLHPKSTTFSKLAGHIVEVMNSPDIIGLEEIQDDSGATNDGTTSGLQTLANLTNAIAAAGGPTYVAMEIAPVNNKDGGAPGGNIHPALLYRSDRLQLDTFSPTVGTNQQSQNFTTDPSTGETTFTLTPGLIDPTSDAWTSSRKPLSASFIVKGSTAERKRLHVIVAHLASKSGSGTSMGRMQVPVNGAIDSRIAQATIIKDFVSEFRSRDPAAHVVLVGDLNDFSGTQPTDILSSVFTELVVPDLAERYSYNFDQNTQQIDHIMVAPILADGAKVEMVHVNTWGKLSEQASDHDPVLAQIRVC